MDLYLYSLIISLGVWGGLSFAYVLWITRDSQLKAEPSEAVPEAPDKE